MPFITEQMALHLTQAGIKDIRQLGYKEIETPPTVINLTKKGNKYYKKVSKGLYDSSLKEVDAFDIESTKVEQKGMYGITDKKTILKGKVKNPPTYELINKETGERVTQGKYGGVLAKYDKEQGFRWGNTTRTEGMTDFMIKFDEKGQALIYPKYSDTSTDLSGLMTVAGVALTATGAGAGLGASFLGGASTAVQSAVGNAFINATISSVTGGDFFKSFLTSAAIPIVSSGMDSVLGNSLFKDLPVSNSFRKIAGSAINRSVTSGVVAAINGQDIGKAMYRGAIRGGVRGGAGIVANKLLTESNVKFITDNTNLSFNDVQKIGTMGLSKGVYNITQGKNFSDGIVDTLVAHGASRSVANKVGSTFKDSFEKNPALLSTIQQTTGKLTNLYIRSAMSGKPISPEMLQRVLLQQAFSSKPIAQQTKKAIKNIAKKGKEAITKDPRDI